MYVKSITLNQQEIHLFDLQIRSSERLRRRAILDSELIDYFFDQDQISYIYHQAGQPAKLRLEPLVLQSLTQPKVIQKTDYHLAISYALPLVAVMWSDKPVALDLCQISNFDGMSEQEIEDFCELYLPHVLPKLTKNSTANTNLLAQAWSSYEAQLKALGLPLQEYSQQLLNQCANLSVTSQPIDYLGQRWWLSVAIQTLHLPHHADLIQPLTLTA